MVLGGTVVVVGGGEEGENEDGQFATVLDSALGSRYAGLRRSRETLSFRPLRSRVKYLSALSSTLNGPSYGCCRGLRTVSFRTNTCAAGEIPIDISAALRLFTYRSCSEFTHGRLESGK